MKLQVFLALFLLTVSAFADEANVVDPGVTGEAKSGMITVTSGMAGEVDVVAPEEVPPEELIVQEPPPEEIAPPGGEVVTAGENQYGSCEIEKEVEGDLITVTATCELSLPTPCHTVNYGWVPGKDEGEFVFSVQIKERPGVCAEVLQKTTVENSMTFNYREGMKFDYKINYIPVARVSPVPVPVSTEVVGGVDERCERAKAALLGAIERLEAQIGMAEQRGDSLELGKLKRLLLEKKHELENLECARNVVQKELPPAAICVKERLELESDLRRLYLALHKAKEEGDEETAGILEDKIKAIKEQLEELPTVVRCAQATGELRAETTVTTAREEKLQEYAARLRKFDLAVRLFNPCDKVSHIDEEIKELEQELELSTGEEAEAIKEKIGALVDVKDAMMEACTELKENSVCGDALRLRAMLERLKDSVESGEISAVRARMQAKELLEKFSHLEKLCLNNVKTMMDNHPCMAARALEVQLDRLSAAGKATDVLGDLYEKVEEYREACLEGGNFTRVRERVREEMGGPGPVSERASDVAKLVGELELRKHLVLMDESLSSEEKTQKIGELEREKLSLIKEAVSRLKRAKISGALRVRFAPRKMEIEGEGIDTDATLELPTTGNDTIEVSVGDQEVELKAKKARVRARLQLDFENGMLKVRGKAIKLPDEVMERIRAEMGDVELKEEEGRPVYEGNATKEFRLFAILPIKAKVRFRADAEAGHLLEMEKPWWTVLAVE